MSFVPLILSSNSYEMPLLFKQNSNKIGNQRSYATLLLTNQQSKSTKSNPSSKVRKIFKLHIQRFFFFFLINRQEQPSTKQSCPQNIKTCTNHSLAKSKKKSNNLQQSGKAFKRAKHRPICYTSSISKKQGTIAPTHATRTAVDRQQLWLSMARTVIGAAQQGQLQR